jgi:hypothetical protein
MMGKIFKIPAYGLLGLLVIITSEIGLYLELWFFEIFMTPLCWSGLILFLDALNYKIAGRSLIRNRSKEFLWMFPWSIALWYVFEFYNLFIQNWHYLGLPEFKVVRYAGYFWSFATIWPGVYEIYELILNLKIIKPVRVKPLPLTSFMLLSSVIFGLICLTLPFVVSARTATYLAAPLWLGMIFLLDPFNYAAKKRSLWGEWRSGEITTLLQLILAGAVAGILWEFWNYWATAKWIYTIPILGHIKLFEMPVLGYLGFLPFAVEIFVMWESVKILLKLK